MTIYKKDFIVNGITLHTIGEEIEVVYPEPTKFSLYSEPEDENTGNVHIRAVVPYDAIADHIVKLHTNIKLPTSYGTMLTHKDEGSLFYIKTFAGWMDQESDLIDESEVENALRSGNYLIK